jgi:hypothetical protein
VGGETKGLRDEGIFLLFTLFPFFLLGFQSFCKYFRKIQIMIFFFFKSWRWFSSFCLVVSTALSCENISPIFPNIQSSGELTGVQKTSYKTKPKPEEQERMPKHHHCPLAKHRGDRNPKYHEEQHGVVVGALGPAMALLTTSITTTTKNHRCASAM